NHMYLSPADENGVLRFGIERRGGGEESIVANEPVTGTINGYSVRIVNYTNGSNPGAFARLNDGTWVENTANGRSDYVEQARDEWSVYLYNPSGNYYIALDLYTKEIYYSASPLNVSNPNRTPVGNISSVDLADTNGFSVTRVRHSNGGFSQLSYTRWVEDAGDKSFTFEELGRTQNQVLLRDSRRGIDITLRLDSMDIYYKQPNVFAEGVIYQIESFRSDAGENNWVHVAVVREGSRGELFINGKSVGVNENMTLQPYQLGLTSRNWVGSPQSVSSENKLKGGIDDFRIYNRALNLEELRELVAPDPELVTFMGTDMQMSPAELEAALAAQGLTLLSTTELKSRSSVRKADMVRKGMRKSDNVAEVAVLKTDECALVYARADGDDIAAEAGLLHCATSFGPEGEPGQVTLTTTAVYGGCDAANPLKEGAGASCSVGVIAGEVAVQLSPEPVEVFAYRQQSALTANACGAISTENLCASAGADLVSASTGIRSEAGSGIGVGASVGVGAGFNGGISDGVLNVGVDLKLVIGFPAKELFKLSKSAFLENQDEIVAVGDKSLAIFKGIGNEVEDANEKILGEVERNGKKALVFVADVGQGIEQGFVHIEDAADDIVEELSSLPDRGEKLLSEGAEYFVSGTTQFANDPQGTVDRTVKAAGKELLGWTGLF
ncbi:MAG: LamG-like jellyroll fold domain-containing protein, partial [Oceanococcaceae bacterium]